MSITPLDHIVEAPLTLKIEGKEVEIIVKSSVYGDIYSIICSLKNEQVDIIKLWFNCDYDISDLEIIAYGHMIKYKLPIILDNQIDDENLLSLKLLINNRKAELNLLDKKVKFEHLRKGWAYDYNKFQHQKHNFSNRQEKEDISNLIDFIKSNGAQSNRELKSSNYTHIRKCVSIFGCLIPHYKSYYLYKYLGIFSNEANKKILKNHFKNYKKVAYKSEVLDGLTYYVSEDVYELLTSYYKEECHKEFNETCNSGIYNGGYSKYLQYLSNFKEKSVKETAWRSIAGPELFFTYNSFKILISFGVPEEEIFKVIRNNLKTCKRCIGVFVSEVYILASNVPKARNLLSTNDFLNLFEKTIQNITDIDKLKFTENIAHFLYWSYDDNVPKHLDKILGSDSLEVKKFTYSLILIMIQKVEEKFNLLPNTTKYLSSLNSKKTLNQLNEYRTETIFKYLYNKKNIIPK